MLRKDARHFVAWARVNVGLIVPCARTIGVKCRVPAQWCKESAVCPHNGVNDRRKSQVRTKNNQLQKKIADILLPLAGRS